MGRWKLAATYFNQYHVKRVGKTSDGFKIEFENGEIVSHDADAILPSSVRGQALLGVDYDQPTGTVLRFTNNISVSLTPDNYEVTHPVCGTCWPERDDEATAALPDDPSHKRVAHGPMQKEDE